MELRGVSLLTRKGGGGEEIDCSRRLDVVNRGFSGYNTSQALEILEQVFPKLSPEGPKMKYLVSEKQKKRKGGGKKD